jgi:hypothetical protein
VCRLTYAPGVPTPERPPRLVERWEALEGGHQAAIAYPICALILVLAHWSWPGLRDEPLLALGYGLFWAMPATAAVVSATANERRKRRARAARAAGDDGDG